MVVCFFATIDVYLMVSIQNDMQQPQLFLNLQSAGESTGESSSALNIPWVYINQLPCTYCILLLRITCCTPQHTTQTLRSPWGPWHSSEFTILLLTSKVGETHDVDKVLRCLSSRPLEMAADIAGQKMDVDATWWLTTVNKWVYNLT